MTAPATAQWLIGDRLANARLSDANGQRVSLHAEFAGLPLWLAFTTSQTLARGLPCPPPGVNALCFGSHGFSAREGWRSFSVEPLWQAGAGADVVWVADANLRLQECRPLSLVNDLAPFMASPRALSAAQLATTAPVLQIPAVYEAEFCARLIEHFEGDCKGGEPSGVVVFEDGKEKFQLDPTIKLRRESPPRDIEIEQHMHERLLRRALPEIARVFNYQVQRRDPFKLLAYAEGAGYFRAHRDNETPDVAHRRFALSVNLNTGAYEGGEFRFPEFGPHQYSPGVGGALVFSCSLLHEVLPVHSGTRYAMTTFLM